MHSNRAALSSLTLLMMMAGTVRAQAPLQTAPFDRANLDTSYPGRSATCRSSRRRGDARTVI